MEADRSDEGEAGMPPSPNAGGATAGVGYVKMSELDVDSDRYDHTSAGPVGLRCRFVICSTQRSGSYLLCRQLINAGIGVPHEYLNPLHVQLLCRRWSLDPRDRAGYVDALYGRRTTPNGVWGTKLQWGQYTTDRDAVEPVLRDATGFIFLYRDDVWAQAVSLHISVVTGVWGFDGTPTSGKASNVQLGDVRHVQFCERIIHQENRHWMSFFSRRRISPIILRYEDLVADQPGAVGHIARVLGLGDAAYRVPPPEGRKDRYPAEAERVKRALLSQRPN